MASAKGRGLSVGIFCGASPSGGGGSALRSKQTPPSTLCRFDRRILCARGKYGSFSSLYRMMEGSAMLFLLRGAYEWNEKALFFSQPCPKHPL